MFTPQFPNSSRRTNPLPTRPPALPNAPAPQQGGPRSVDYRAMRRTPVREKQPGGIKVLDHRDLRMQAERGDRRRDTLDIPTTALSYASDTSNPEFVHKILPEAEEKMVDIWIEPNECTDIYVNKLSGIEIRNCKVIGINGRQWPLLPGNNRVPWIVMEAVETGRELNSRYKSRIAPSYKNRKVMFNDPRSSVKSGYHTNYGIWRQDSMLGQPGVADGSVIARATDLHRQHKEAYLKSLKTK